MRLPADIASNPGWYMLDYNPAFRKFIFTSLEETRFAEASFLDSRLNTRADALQGVTLADVDAVFPDRFELPPAAYIFQVGHCGSTLLSRALGATPDVLALREPLPLRVLANTRRELDDALSWMSREEWRRLSTIILLALERRFRPGQLPIIKASSTCNNLVEPVLASHPGRRALLLYQPLETSLAAMFRNRANFGDLRSQGRDRLQEWLDLAGQEDMVLADLEEDDVAVLSWIASLQRFEQARQRLPERVMMLDFNRFIADPHDHLHRVAAFLGLDAQAEQLANAFANVSRRYAKNPGKPYSPERRQASLDSSRRHNAEGISRAMDKARALLQSHPDMAGLEPYLEG